MLGGKNRERERKENDKTNVVKSWHFGNLGKRCMRILFTNFADFLSEIMLKYKIKRKNKKEWVRRVCQIEKAGKSGKGIREAKETDKY